MIFIKSLKDRIREIEKSKENTTDLESNLGLLQKCDVEYALRWGEPIDIDNLKGS